MAKSPAAPGNTNTGTGPAELDPISSELLSVMAVGGCWREGGGLVPSPVPAVPGLPTSEPLPSEPPIAPADALFIPSNKSTRCGSVWWEWRGWISREVVGVGGVEWKKTSKKARLRSRTKRTITTF